LVDKEKKLKEIDTFKKQIDVLLNQKLILYKEKQKHDQVLQDLKGKIRVMVRLRPLNDTEYYNWKMDLIDTRQANILQNYSGI
jgi:hypothetical protein